MEQWMLKYGDEKKDKKSVKFADIDVDEDEEMQSKVSVVEEEEEEIVVPVKTQEKKVLIEEVDDTVVEILSQKPKSRRLVVEEEDEESDEEEVVILSRKTQSDTNSTIKPVTSAPEPVAPAPSRKLLVEEVDEEEEEEQVVPIKSRGQKTSAPKIIEVVDEEVPENDVVKGKIVCSFPYFRFVDLDNRSVSFEDPILPSEKAYTPEFFNIPTDSSPLFRVRLQDEQDPISIGAFAAHVLDAMRSDMHTGSSALHDAVKTLNKHSKEHDAEDQLSFNQQRNLVFAVLDGNSEITLSPRPSGKTPSGKFFGNLSGTPSAAEIALAQWADLALDRLQDISAKIQKLLPTNIATDLSAPLTAAQQAPAVTVLHTLSHLASPSSSPTPNSTTTSAPTLTSTPAPAVASVATALAILPVLHRTAPLAHAIAAPILAECVAALIAVTVAAAVTQENFSAFSHLATAATLAHLLPQSLGPFYASMPHTVGLLCFSITQPATIARMINAHTTDTTRKALIASLTSACPVLALPLTPAITFTLTHVAETPLPWFLPLLAAKVLAHAPQRTNNAAGLIATDLSSFGHCNQLARAISASLATYKAAATALYTASSISGGNAHASTIAARNVFLSSAYWAAAYSRSTPASFSMFFVSAAAAESILSSEDLSGYVDNAVANAVQCVCKIIKATPVQEMVANPCFSVSVSEIGVLQAPLLSHAILASDYLLARSNAKAAFGLQPLHAIPAATKAKTQYRKAVLAVYAVNLTEKLRAQGAVRALDGQGVDYPLTFDNARVLLAAALRLAKSKDAERELQELGVQEGDCVIRM